MKQAYTYSDVLIKPKYSEIETRSSVDVSVKINNLKLKLPVVSANMKAVTGSKMASTIAKNGGLGLLHRFCTIEDNIKMFQEANDLLIKENKIVSYTGSDYNFNVGVSIGVKEEDKERFEKLYEAGARIFCVDVAHGHNINVKRTLQWLNGLDCRKEVTVIAGNIATPEAYNDLVQWGADVVKVGIGPSPVCRTRFNTGCGVPQLFALEEIYYESCKLNNPISIIADGGISHVGDIAKALKYADCVMLGSMISGTSETPGHVFRSEDNEYYKVYGGSASGENKGENKFVEGVIKTVKFKGKVKYVLREIEHGLQSAFSYVGAKNHKEFQEKCEFNFLSYGSQKESKI
jgi:IMP dehydrogenase